MHSAADGILCRPLFGIPFFFAVLALVFFLSFSGPGAAVSRFSEAILLRYDGIISEFLLHLGVSDFTVRYLIGGVYAALVSAISFLPQTAVFFLFIRALDDCGYLARAEFVTDRFFRIFGLSGRAVIPILLGYGCAVSSVCACEKGSSEGNAVIGALPFIPCSARLPVLLFLADSFFPEYKVVFSVSVFILSYVLIFLSLLIEAGGRGEVSAEIEVLPEYRFPDIRGLWDGLVSISRGYLIRACTAVGLCSIVFSGLAMLTPALGPAWEMDQSLLYGIGASLSPLFRPLGFGCAQASVALIFGFFAKENMISVFLLPTAQDLPSILSPAAAISFTVFSMFYAPCASLLFAVGQRSGIRASLKLFFRTFFIAYSFSLVLYTLSHIIETHC